MALYRFVTLAAVIAVANSLVQGVAPLGSSAGAVASQLGLSQVAAQQQRGGAGVSRARLAAMVATQPEAAVSEAPTAAKPAKQVVQNAKAGKGEQKKKGGSRHGQPL
eukprot:509409-Prymnesium_polylepis.1